MPFLARNAITLGIDAGMINASYRLLKLNGIPGKALDFSISTKTIFKVLWGAIVGVLAIVIIAGILYLFVPYHFVPGPLGSMDILKSSISYLLGNSLEEFLFRGFLFILFSQWIGWPISCVILAILFGLFHLPGAGLGMNGLKMFATTACYSFIFSFSFILFRSLWTPIAVHTISNILLHSITGLDGSDKARFVLVFERNWPTGYDLGFLVLILSTMIVVGILLLAIELRKRRLFFKSYRTSETIT